MKKIIFCIFFAIAAIMLSTAQDCHAANLLANPGFEQGDFPPKSWDDWSGSESDNPATAGIAGFPAPRELSHSGSKAVGKILYGTGERWGGFSQTVGVTGGRLFKASGWVMNNKNDVALGKGAKAFIEVKFLDDSENEVKKAKSSSITRSTDWNRLSVKGLVPGRAKKAIFSFVLTGHKGSRGKVFFDDASLTISD